MKLIGITGKARSGKDTIAKHLFHTHEFTRVAFADPLKHAASHIFGLSGRQTWDDELKEKVIPYWGKSPRQLFQLLGTEAIKPVFGDDTWVKRFEITYNLLKDTDHMVVPDVRVDVEANRIRELGGVIIEVRRGSGLVGSTGSHISELGLSTLPDFVIENHGSIDELKANVDRIVGGL